MSTEYDVCLVITTQAATLLELSEKIGVEPAYGSHEMGDPHVLKSRGSWKQTVWKVCSACSKAASLEEHFESVAAQLPAIKLRAPGILPDAVEVHVSVGLFSDDQIPTAALTLRCLAISQSYGASIEVCLFESDMSKVRDP